MEQLPKSEGPERLPTVEVPNSVIWVNDKMRTPLQFELGEQSNLGILLSLSDEATEGFPGIPRDNHWRTLDIGQAYFEDTTHRLYRDLDIKGSGLISPESKKPAQWRNKHRVFSTVPAEVLGLLDRSEAEHDVEIAEKFAKLGIRTHRAVALIELDALNDGARVVSVGELKQKRKLPEHFSPVIEVRAFGIKTRVHDIFPLRTIDPLRGLGDVEREYARRELTGTLAFLSKDPLSPMSIETYSSWFVEEVARNIGTMHNAGYVHAWLHAQNITLDGGLTDFDSVQHISQLALSEHLSAGEIEADQRELLCNDINFTPKADNTEGILSWLELYVWRLKQLFPTELDSVNLAETRALFLKTYSAKITNPQIRRLLEPYLSKEI